MSDKHSDELPELPEDSLPELPELPDLPELPELPELEIYRERLQEALVGRRVTSARLARGTLGPAAAGERHRR